MPRTFRYIGVAMDTPDLLQGVRGRQGRFIARVLKAEYRAIIATSIEARAERLSKYSERRLARVVEAVAKLWSTGHGFRFPSTIVDFTGKRWTVGELSFMQPYLYYKAADLHRKTREMEQNAGTH